MKGLTPEERWALERLLLPVGSRTVPEDSREHELRMQLVEQGRATRTMYLAPVRNRHGSWSYGRCDITPAGREALKIWPAVQEALDAR